MEDQDIVEVDDDMSFIYEVVEDVLHDGLECGWCYDSLLIGGSGRTCSKDTEAEGDTLGG